MANRQPFAGSGRLQEGGVLATRKQDFNAHIDGTSFRQQANTIDMNPVIAGLNGSTVQDTLNDLHNLIVSSGTGFISIGNTDGYALGSYNVGSISTPTLYDAFNAAFSDSRLQNGGVILLLAGTYTLKSTVNVPSGITIAGEVGGTLIVGEMSESPMFIVHNDIKTVTIGGDSGSGQIDLLSGSNVEVTKFYNLMLADNLNGNINSGQPGMTTVPMIQAKYASNLICERVSFIGRIQNTTTVSGRSKTYAAIAYTTGGADDTNLTMEGCFLDGLKIGIRFDPVSSLNFLTVNNCRARTYGTEDSGNTDKNLNSFIVANLCIGKITNNFFNSEGSEVNTFLYIPSGTEGNLTVIGNQGGLANENLGQLIYNDSGSTFTSIQTGNDWGITIGNPWYIVVGGAGGSSTGMGDIFGSSAINVVLQMASFFSNFQATIIVNPGTYNVTGTLSHDFANLKFIGNKIGKNYPIFSLNIHDTTPDALGQRFITLGNHLEAIQFVSTVRFQSIHAGWNPTSSTVSDSAFTLKVTDCVFVDTSLVVMDPGSPNTDTLGNNATLSEIIENCYFRQTGTFNDSISLCSPIVQNTILRGCNFIGFGYAVNFGDDFQPSSISDTTLHFENNTFNLIGFTIDDAAPNSLISNYIRINSFSSSVFVDRCQVLTSDLNKATIVNSSLRSAGTFTIFAYFGANQVYIDRSTLEGTYGTVTISSVAYNMPCFFVEAIESIKVTDNRFFGGSLPFKIGGPSCFTNSNTRGDIVVSNNEFISRSTTETFTMIDMDLDIASGSGIIPKIIVDNNIIHNLATSSTSIVQHTEQITNYVIQGIVQIYAPFFSVVFANNKVFGTTLIPTSNTFFTDWTGVVINTFDATTGTSGGAAATVNVYDNKIEITNTINNSTSDAACLNVIASVLNIHNNYLAMNNSSGAVASTFIGCLTLNNRPTATGTYSDGIVTDNVFSRRNITGTASTLSEAYVRIESNSGRGAFKNNSFCDPFIDTGSTLTTVVLDSSVAPNFWIINGNKNQTDTIDLMGWYGVVANSSSSSGHAELKDSASSQIVIEVLDVIAPSNTINVNYTASTAGSFLWAIPLYGLIPIGARIISITCSGQSDTVMTNGTFTHQLVGNGLVTVGGAGFDFESGYTINTVNTSTITPSNSSSTNTFDNTATNGLRVELFALSHGATSAIKSSTNAVMNFTSMTVKYRY